MQNARRNLLLLAALVVAIAAWLVVRTEERRASVAVNTGPGFSMIEEGLYQGGHVPEPPPGTVAVLNLCEVDDVFQCEIHRHDWIPDRAPAPSLDWLRKRVEFVDEQRRAGRVTYVHCFGGVSRAGMVMTAYEMYKNNWTRDEALQFVRSKRPVTNPNPAFTQLLKEWEDELRSRPSEKKE
jgi:hypothetical protein